MVIGMIRWLAFVLWNERSFVGERMKIRFSWLKYIVGAVYIYLLMTDAPNFARLLRLEGNPFPYLPWVLLGWFLLLWGGFTFGLARYNLSTYHVFFLAFSGIFGLLAVYDLLVVWSFSSSSPFTLIESFLFTLWMVAIAADPEFLEKKDTRGISRENRKEV